MVSRYRWGFSFLQTDTMLTYEQRSYLLQRATEMYLEGEEKRDIFLQNLGDTYSLEGRISTKGEQGVLGSLVGIKFSAEIDTNKGKARVSFLVSEQTGRIFGSQASSPVETYVN